jgi:adenylate cyclase class IV
VALPKEIEIKLRVEDIADLRRRLAAAGARVGKRDGARRRGQVFEHNVIFDLPGEPLRKRGALLRLRWRMPVSHPRATHAAGLRKKKMKAPPRWTQPLGDAVFTYKGRATRRGGYKVADELEMAVGDPRRLAEILEAMGFRPSFRYEKFRTELRIPKVPGLAVDLDETPIGNFVELEGPRKAIDRAAALLGRSRRDYLTGSYASLYGQFCRRQHRPFDDMLFRPGKK